MARHTTGLEYNEALRQVQNAPDYGLGALAPTSCEFDEFLRKRKAGSVPVYPNRRIAQLSGDIPMPLPGSVPDGGHAMCVVGYGFDDGYLGGGYVIVRNSWGTGWASQSEFGAGYGKLPFAYLRQFGWEAFSVLPPKR